MAIKGSGSPMEAVDEYFDMLIKSRFNEMFGSVKGNEKGLKKSTLNTICHQIVDGSHNPSKGGNPSDYLMLSSKNVIDGSITHDNPRYLSKEDFDLEDKRTRVRPGDILMTIVGTIGRTAIVPKNAGNLTFQRSVAVLHIDHQQIDPVFLKSCLDSIQADIDAEAHGSSQKGIYLNQVEKIPVLVPDLSIQKKFSSFVQQVDKSKAIVQKCIDKYDLLVKSRFIEMFGTRNEYAKKWQMKPFTACCDVLYGYPFNSQLFNDNGEGMPLIRVRDINTAFSNTYTTENVSPIYQVHDGDILVGMDGDFYAKIWSSGTALLNQRTCKMKGRRDVVNDLFMLHYLNPELLEIHRNTASTTVKHLSAKEINKMQMPLPPIELQEQFVAFVKQVDKSKFEVVQSLLRLKSKYIRTETPSKRTDCDL
ncbi:restriction endonuclease subunit S [Methanomethylophilus alvi]|uniref:restriction endonuclease subunit S n=1 Tax=Methanomethylophilus alvi TaxID=1291540 RepID=UPI0037DD14F9